MEDLTLDVVVLPTEATETSDVIELPAMAEYLSLWVALNKIYSSEGMIEDKEVAANFGDLAALTMQRLQARAAMRAHADTDFLTEDPLVRGIPASPTCYDPIDGTTEMP